MSDGREDLALRLLRRIHEKLDRVLSELGDMKPRPASLECQTGDLVVDKPRDDEP